ncbi:MAG: J domain-containing protein [Alcanivoracaceae bacterium]|jgi:hypothetical protein|nr:J domain-containing protein [Alcanivoracaceae bacterium]
MDFLHCYRVLGLTPDCDWEHARHRYQQLASRHHPDRPLASADARTLTEINHAWRQLRKYYQQHGHLPLQANQVTPSDRPVTPFAQPPTPMRAHPGRWLALIVLAAALALFMPGRCAQPRQAEQIADAPAEPVAIEEPASNSRIGLGDPLGHVVETLGPPDDTRGPRWYYGPSWIEFRDGRVSDWHSSADRPLPTDTLGHHWQR